MKDSFKIETSIGIIEIPMKAAFSDSLDPYFEEEWYIKLYKLYKFHSLTLEPNPPKNVWLKIHLEDEHYGYPEYKIITD